MNNNDFNKITDLMLEIGNLRNENKKLLQDKEELKKQLALYSVSNSKRINLMVFEGNTRCYKLTNKELETYTKQGMIEKGDKHYKCELIKKY